MQTWHAMGTEVTLHAPELREAQERALAGELAALFEAAEARFSRFRRDSELARLSFGRGPTRVSPELWAALRRAQEHQQRTRGLFDPTLGAELTRLGYDRSFEQLTVAARAGTAHADVGAKPRGSVRAREPGGADEAAAARRPAARAPAGPLGGDRLTLDLEAGTVELPPGVQLDLGGMIKGATVDRAAALLPRNALLDAGGDLYAKGDDPLGDGGWAIEVEDPDAPGRALLELCVRDAAVATSAANRRRWPHRGQWAHHLIDPRTRAPARSSLRQVTVVASGVELAEVLAKSIYLAGPAAGLDLLTEHPQAEALVIDEQRRVLRAGAALALACAEAP